MQNEQVNLMSKTIRSFSFLIKSRSLFFELIEELHENKDFTPEQWTCYLVKMFGGTTIRIPSLSELLLFQWLLNNQDKAAKAFKRNDIRHAADTLAAIIRSEYKGDLSSLNVWEISCGFIEAIRGESYFTEAVKLIKQDIATTQKKLAQKHQYQNEILECSDDCPMEDEDE